MEHSGYDATAALIAPLQHLSVRNGFHTGPNTPMNRHRPIVLWLELQALMRQYWIVLSLNLFHNQEQFKQDPQVQAFMQQAQADLEIPALTGPGLEHIILRRDATFVLADLLSRLPLYNAM